MPKQPKKPPLLVIPAADVAATRLVSRADAARMKDCSRAAVTKAARPGGPLYPARLAGDRLNAAHPSFLRWLNPGFNRLDDTMTRSAAELAGEAGVTVDEVRKDLKGPLGKALLPVHHVTAKIFAYLCGVTVAAIEVAALGDLGPAVTPQGLIDIGHDAALRFAAKHPYRRDRRGEAVGVPRGVLVPALLPDDMIDANHPFAKHFFSRCDGRVPTEADFAP